MQHNSEKNTDSLETSSPVVVPERLVHGGAALVRTDSGVAFVEGALPGERVRIGPIYRDRGTPRADLLEIVEPSPHRREPECPLFGACGGCDWQHLEYVEQIRWKREILAENFRRLGAVEIPAGDIGVISGDEYGYRSRVQIHAGAEGTVGFRRRSSHETIPVSHCPVATPAINAELSALSRRSFPDAATHRKTRTVLVERDDGVAVGGVDRVAEISVDGAPVRFDPAGFAQSNRQLLPELARRLQHAYAGGPLVDLYAGAGLLTAMVLAGSPSHDTATPPDIICVEPDRRNARFIPKNLSVRGYTDTVRVVTTTAERAISAVPLKRMSHPNATVLLDPPRGGLSKAVTQWLTGDRTDGGGAPGRTAPARVIYVSCDAAALARDVGRLSAVYTVRELTLVDFYPQTAHIEALAVLDRRENRTP